MTTRYKVGMHTQAGSTWVQRPTMSKAMAEFRAACNRADTWWCEVVRIDSIGRRSQVIHWHNAKLHAEIMAKVVTEDLPCLT